MSDTEAPVDHAAIAEQSRENVDAWISQDPAKMEWANRPDNGVPDRKPGDSVYTADPRNQDAQPAPKTEAALVERAATTLSQLGPEGEALVQEWGGHTSPDFHENIAYARQAFSDIVANRPDLIAKVDASGLGNDPAILKLLAEHGRMQANTLGDSTVSSRMDTFLTGYETPGQTQARPRGQSGAQDRLNQLYKDNPPGTEKYKQPHVQKEIARLMSSLHGDGDIVGTGGRTA
jgi:hypothetical protein